MGERVVDARLRADGPHTRRCNVRITHALDQGGQDEVSSDLLDALDGLTALGAGSSARPDCLAHSGGRQVALHGGVRRISRQRVGIVANQLAQAARSSVPHTRVRVPEEGHHALHDSADCGGQVCLAALAGQGNGQQASAALPPVSRCQQRGKQLSQHGPVRLAAYAECHAVQSGAGCHHHLFVIALRLIADHAVRVILTRSPPARQDGTDNESRVE